MSGKSKFGREVGKGEPHTVNVQKIKKKGKRVTYKIIIDGTKYQRKRGEHYQLTKDASIILAIAAWKRDQKKLMNL